jgi:hypothetical protein
MKSVILNVRISLEIKNVLVDEANKKGTNFSDNIREILTNHCQEEQNKHSILGNKIYNSNEFLFLFAWLMEKRRYQNDNNEIGVLNDLKNVTYKVINDESIEEYIREEFEKVHFDLKRFIKHFGSPNNSFDFCDPNNGNNFDYSGLLEYINAKAFENRIYL